jgi:glycosyltransferase involved in cell wall biosynthesis
MSNPRNITLHFIQDIPTPHNNVLLRTLAEDVTMDLRIWYGRLTHPKYSFSADLGYEVGMPIVYGHRLPSLRLIKTALLHRKDRFFIVGWMNPTMRLLILLFWLLRRPFNMWFDLPADHATHPVKKVARQLYYFLLRTSSAKIFAVGSAAMQFFKRKGFAENRLVNFPIFVSVEKPLDAYREHCKEIREKYGVSDEDLFITTGSRLIHEKGFDLLIQAIAMLDDSIKAKIKLLIVGRGPEKEALEGQVLSCRLEGQVFFEDWMDYDALMAHIGSSDLAAHPARFDAFGGTTLSAMVAGTPVLGSRQAGSASERIVHGKNGWLYHSMDVASLAHYLAVAVQEKPKLKSMGRSARQTAEKWSPALGVRLMKEHLV